MEVGSRPSPANQPRTRQRAHKEPPTIDVPDINDDAAERKRVLNVLAQRRYRERKRQSRAGGSAASTGGTPRDQNQEAPGSEAAGSSSSPAHADLPATAPLGLSEGQQQQQQLVTDLPLQPGLLSLPAEPDALGLGFDMDMPWMLTASFNGVGAPQSSFMDLSPLDQQQQTSSSGGSATTSSDFSNIMPTVNPSALLDPFSASHATGSSSNTGTDKLSPDSYLLPVTELTLLRAFLRIADRLGVTSTVWDPGAVSPFCPRPHSIFQPSSSYPLSAASPASASSSSSSPPSPSSASSPLSSSASAGLHLPPTWRPTALQSAVPHHPVFDFLPWPSARDRIIQVFSLPEGARPASARGPMGMVQFVYDLEDSAEGIRIFGGDPCDPAGWEVGQVLFERWWFIFDREIVEQSNQWRGIRGAAALKLTLAGG